MKPDTIEAAEDESDQAGMVEIDAQNGNSGIPIFIQVPERFRYGSSKGAVKSTGVNLLTYYPSFTSPHDAENRNYGMSCAGYCNGQILVSIENSTSSTQEWRGMADFMANLLLKGSGPWDHSNPRVRYEEEGPQYGFDRVIKRTIAQADDPNVLIPSDLSTELYFLKRSKQGDRYETYVNCHPLRIYPGCQLYFSLACNPAVGIQVSVIKYDLIAETMIIQKRVDEFISAMVRRPECKP